MKNEHFFEKRCNNLIVITLFFNDPDKKYNQYAKIIIFYIVVTTFVKIFCGFIFILIFLFYRFLTPLFDTSENNQTNNEVIEVEMEEVVARIPDQECPICLEKNEEEKWVKIKCGHNFHSICIKNWIVIQKSCPICRQNL